MKVPVRPELPTAALRGRQATPAAVDNSAPLVNRLESTYKSGNAVQIGGATSELLVRQPTMRRAYTSITKATYCQPCQVET